MDNAILSVIKAELNYLYHEPTKPGSDGGWFCREHAFHTYFLATMLGEDTSIIAGDFTANIRAGRSLHSYESSHEHGHYWNEIKGVKPVDLSLSFRYVHNPHDDVGPICQQDLSGRYAIVTVFDDNTCKQYLNSPLTRIICYCEREQLRPNCYTLLEHPYELLIRPKANALSDLMGIDFFNCITIHLYNVVRGTADALYKTGMEPPLGMIWIRQHYPKPTETVAVILKEHEGK